MECLILVSLAVMSAWTAVEVVRLIRDLKHLRNLLALLPSLVVLVVAHLFFQGFFSYSIFIRNELWSFLLINMMNMPEFD